MASKFLSSQTVKATRGFAAQAAAKQSPAAGELALLPREPVKTTTLSNGIVVASIETNAPLSRVGIAFRAGTRNEPAGKEGLTHIVRMASSLSNKKSTQFAMVRSLNQAGASLTCTVGREHLLYSLDTNRQQVDQTLSKLSDAATQQVFKPWEINDNLYRIKLELAGIEPEVQVLELLHKVAFRSGLANSLFCPPHLVGKHCTNTLNSFVAANLRADNAAVIGVGIQHDRLVAYAQQLALKAGQAPALPASKVHGGDARVETSGPLAYVALAAPGAPLSDTKKMLTLALIQRVLGSGNPVKYGANSGSKLSQALMGTGAGSAINLSYSDAGLIGVALVAPAADAGKAVSAAAKAFRSVKVTDSQLARAKAQLKADLLMAEESTDNLMSELTIQSLINKSAGPATADLVAAASKLTAADVNAVASQLASAKLAVAAVGNLSNVPFADEL